jgi:hypothetical protein
MVFCYGWLARKAWDQQPEKRRHGMGTESRCNIVRLRSAAKKNPRYQGFFTSGRPDSNRRPSPWQSDTPIVLPLWPEYGRRTVHWGAGRG